MSKIKYLKVLEQKDKTGVVLSVIAIINDEMKMLKVQRANGVWQVLSFYESVNIDSMIIEEEWSYMKINITLENVLEQIIRDATMGHGRNLNKLYKECASYLRSWQ